MNYSFYTDGAVKGNAGSASGGVYGGIGVYSEQLDISISKRYPNATNNKMELMAILVALQCIKRYLATMVDQDSTFTIFSDSNYSIQCCTLWYKIWNKKKNGWKDKKNVELIKEITEILEEYPSKISLKFCKGHAGIPGNEMADQLANKALM